MSQVTQKRRPGRGLPPGHSWPRVPHFSRHTTRGRAHDVLTCRPGVNTRPCVFMSLNYLSRHPPAVLLVLALAKSRPTRTLSLGDVAGPGGPKGTGTCRQRRGPPVSPGREDRRGRPAGPGREDRPRLWNAPSSVPFSAGGAKDYRTSVALNSRRPPGDAAAVTEFPGTVLTANASRGRRPSQDPVVPSPLRLRSEVRRAELCPVAGEASRCLFHATPSSSD